MPELGEFEPHLDRDWCRAGHEHVDLDGDPDTRTCGDFVAGDRVSAPRRQQLAASTARDGLRSQPAQRQQRLYPIERERQTSDGFTISTPSCNRVPDCAEQRAPTVGYSIEPKDCGEDVGAERVTVVAGTLLALCLPDTKPIAMPITSAATSAAAAIHRRSTRRRLVSTTPGGRLTVVSTNRSSGSSPSAGMCSSPARVRSERARVARPRSASCAASGRRAPCRRARPLRVPS